MEVSSVIGLSSNHPLGTEVKRLGREFAGQDEQTENLVLM